MEELLSQDVKLKSQASFRQGDKNLSNAQHPASDPTIRVLSGLCF